MSDAAARVGRDEVACGARVPTSAGAWRLVKRPDCCVNLAMETVDLRSGRRRPGNAKGWREELSIMRTDPFTGWFKTRNGVLTHGSVAEAVVEY